MPTPDFYCLHSCLFLPCIMCVQYYGGAQDCGGYHEYRRGYLEYRGGLS